MCRIENIILHVPNYFSVSVQVGTVKAQDQDAEMADVKMKKAPSTAPRASASANEGGGKERRAGAGEVDVHIKQQQQQQAPPPTAAVPPVAAAATATAVVPGAGGRSGSGSGSGSSKHFFTPKPMAGPRPALARGGWASLTASTAAATFVTPRNGAAGHMPEKNASPGGTGSVGGSGSNNAKESRGDMSSSTTGAVLPASKQAAPEGPGALESAAAAAGSESWWVHQPAAVLRCLRELLLGAEEAPRPASSSSSSSSGMVGKGQSNGSASEKGAPRSSSSSSLSPSSSRPALVSLLHEAGCGDGDCGGGAVGVVPPSPNAQKQKRQKPQPKAQDEQDFAAGLRKDPLHHLAGKMRLLLTAELSGGCGEKKRGGGSNRGAATATAEGRAEPGLQEFISLVEDVHRSVERTTRQQ